jgi:alkanesulfonate monooxygenase
MSQRDVRYGVALRNFTAFDETPDMDEILSYTLRAEQLGFHSAWAWDHILLGSKRPFPFLESLSTLTALATRTTHIELGTGVLILPLRNPVVLAKVLASLDRIAKGRLTVGMAAGWYEKEFEAVGVPFTERGRIFVENIKIMKQLWTDDAVDGAVGPHVFKRVTMLPKPFTPGGPRLLFGGYVDRVLRRTAAYADGWLTYFYTPQSFARAWAKIRQFAAELGRDPSTLTNVSQLPICVAPSFEEADARVRSFIAAYFDMAAWSESTADSAIRGTPEQCAEQIQQHIAVGERHIVFVPYNYEHEQLERIAKEILPLIEPVMERA